MWTSDGAIFVGILIEALVPAVLGLGLEAILGDPNKGEKKRRIRGWIYLGAFALVILLNIAWIAIPRIVGPRIAITDPADNSVVETHCLWVRGTHQYVPDDRDIWLLVQSERTDFIYPQSSVVTSQDGTWTGRACLGSQGESGNFAIVAVLVPPGFLDFQEYLAESRVSGSFPGLSRAPEGVQEFARVFVTLR